MLLLPVYDDPVSGLKLKVYSEADETEQATIRACYDAIINVDQYAEAANNCAQIGYSIMAELYDGAIGTFMSLYNYIISKKCACSTIS